MRIPERLAILWAGVLLAPSVAFAQTATQPTIQSVSLTGSACPDGTVGRIVADDGTTATLLFDAAIGAGGCVATVTLQVPAGASSTPGRIVLRGYARVPAAVSATVTTSATFNGGPLLTSDTQTMAGPSDADYTLSRDFTLTTSEAAATTRDVTIDLDQALSADNPSALLAFDSLDVAIGSGSATQSLTLVRDSTTPIVVAIPSDLPNAAGWFNANVTVTFACVPPDGFAIVADQSSLAPVALTSSGTATGTCVVADENDSSVTATASASYTAQIDKVPPTIAVATPVANAIYGRGVLVTVSVQCHDAGSGIQSCVAPATIDTSTLGLHSITVTATDLAGNSAHAVVPYRVGGKDDCKKGGWELFAQPTFRNQGQCVSSFVP